MAAERLEDEREHLLGLIDQIRELCAEARRLNRRLRNARAAVRTLENDLVRLCDDIAARVERLHRQGPGKGSR
ncbi:MAG TPA: hypothetical protein VFA19_07875 [Gaiellaceae bacterium]|nr:hypothetical protein [Gaiellaceae bacterium]